MVVSSFVRTMIPLRWLAVGGNLGFLVYGVMQPSLVMMLLHGTLLPINCLRAAQMVWAVLAGPLIGLAALGWARIVQLASSLRPKGPVARAAVERREASASIARRAPRLAGVDNVVRLPALRPPRSRVFRRAGRRSVG